MSANTAHWWKSIFKTSSLIGLSKVFGFLRDVLVAAFFGTSSSADAFNFAYLFTGNIFILLGGLNGPFHSAVVSTLSRIKADSPTQNERRENAFLSIAFTQTTLVFALLALLLYFSAPSLFALILKGQASLLPEVLIQNGLMLPVFILTGSIGLLFGAVSHKGHYFWPSISPLISSITLILIIVLAFNWLGPWTLGLGTSLGAIFQGVIQLIDLHKLGFRFSWPKPPVDQTCKQDMAHFRGILFPALLSSTIGSLNVYVDSFFCSSLQEGSWTAILTANRLIQLPFGILLGSSLMSFLPRISAIANKPDEFGASLKKEIFNLLIILIPASALMFALSEPLIRVLFQRGQFDETSTRLVNMAVLFLCGSLLTALPREILTRAFYAIGDSKTPLWVSFFSIIWNAVLDWLLAPKLQVAGIALSTTFTALINSLLLLVLLRRKMPIMGKFNWTGSIFFSFAGLVAFLSAKGAFVQLLPWLSWLNQWQSFVSFINLAELMSLMMSTVLSMLLYLGSVALYKKYFQPHFLSS